MIITYHGVGACKVVFGDTTIGFNPVSKESKEKATRFSADIGIITTLHPDCNGADGLHYNGKEAFIIDGAGEYEVKGVFVRGFPAKTRYGGTEMVNTIYTVSLEGMNICFLGPLSNAELAPEVRGALGDIDILFVPIGGGEVLEASEAYSLAVKLGSRIVIPIHYDTASMKAFIKEGGSDGGGEILDKLTVKRRDLDGKEGEIVVLQAQ